MYVLELFDVVPAPTTIDYADGNPVTVPAGALCRHHRRAERAGSAGDRGVPIATGAIDLDDPDAPKFPGFGASPPNRPDAPAGGSVIGWNTKRPE